jgi:hypothetical protein
LASWFPPERPIGFRRRIAYASTMLKLQQGQLWKVTDGFVRIVELHRLEVKYKALEDPSSPDGTHHHVTKKEFCRLIKGGTLVEDRAEAV